MTPIAARITEPRRLAVLVGAALIGSLFVPAAALAVGPSVTVGPAVGQVQYTHNSPVNFAVEFSDPVEGFTSGDVITGGDAGGTKTATVTGGPNAYNVAVAGMTTGGTVTVRVPANVADNPAGESNLASTGGYFAYWWPGPFVAISPALGQSFTTGTSPINWTVAFDQPVEGFTGGDVVVGGSAGGTKTAIVTGGPMTYNVAIAGMTVGGSVTISVPENVVDNPAGESNDAGYSAYTITWAPGGPSVTINQWAGQADPTGTSPINFTVAFSAVVTGFDSGDVTIGGTAGGTKTATVTGSGTTYNVAVSGMTTGGTVSATVPGSVALDASIRPNLASTSTDHIVTWAPVGPSVTIKQAAGQADPTGTSPINFTVLFNVPVTGFASGDVTIGGTAGGTKTAIVTGSGTTYNVVVSGMTTSGTVIATIPESVAIDAGSQPNQASTSTDNTVTWTAVATSISLTTSAPSPPGAKDPVILWGQGFTLNVQFGTNGANKSFQLQGTRDGVAWTTITTLTTDANGRASLFYRPVTNLFYRAVFAGTPDLAAATSNQVRTVVRQLAVMRPTNNGSTKSIDRNTSIAFTATVRPARPELAPPNVRFMFYLQISGVWQLVTTRDVVANSAGRAQTTFQFTSSGEWYVRSQAGPTPYNANSVPTEIERYSVS